MKTHPMLFSEPMALAIQERRKTQTRRALSPQPSGDCRGFQKVFAEPPFFEALDARGRPIHAFTGRKGCASPYPPIAIAPGDLCWVREPWRAEAHNDNLPPRDLDPESCRALYLSDKRWSETPCGHTVAGRYRHARFMPRRFSRATLEITDVRVQRLWDISIDDVIEEGIDLEDGEGARLFSLAEQTVLLGGSNRCRYPEIYPYVCLWEDINGRGAWDANPWIVAYTFDVHLKNIDALLQERIASNE